jgi:hypothetical protein
MSTQILVTLSDAVYQRAQRLAELTGRAVDEVLADLLAGTLPPLRSELDQRPVELLPDDAVMELSESMMEPNQSARMSALADRQQAGSLTEAERAELQMLFDIFEAGQLRKAQALVEAVRRGLRELMPGRNRML